MLCKLIHVEESYFFMNMLNSESGHGEKGPEVLSVFKLLYATDSAKCAFFNFIL